MAPGYSRADSIRSVRYSLLRRWTDWSDTVFGAYARLATRHPWLLLLAGLAVAVAFGLGLLTVTISTDINELWVDTDSRVVDEKALYEASFGGTPRRVSVTLQRTAGTVGVAAAEALAAHQATVSDLFNASVLERGTKFVEEDFCEKPLVPSAYKPGQLLTAGVAGISQCLAVDKVFINVTWPVFVQSLGRDVRQTPYIPLSLTWGIDSFPCSRSSPLDCFKEGGDVGYPESLKQLEGVAPVMSFAKNTLISTLLKRFDNRSSTYQQYQQQLLQIQAIYGDKAMQASVDKCIIQVLGANPLINMPAANLTVLLQQNPSSLPQSALGLVGRVRYLQGLLSRQIDGFGIYGYWWRPSYKDKSPQEILEIFRRANESTNNPNVTVAQCIAERTAGRRCCLAWSGNKIALGLFIGNVDLFDNGTYKAVQAIQTGMIHYSSKSPLWRHVLTLRSKSNWTDDQQIQLTDKFEKAVLDKWLPRYERRAGSGFGSGEKYAAFKIALLLERSLSDLISDATDLDTTLLVLSYVAMLVFICLSLGKLPLSGVSDLINSHILLGSFGLITVALATVAGLGFSAYAGVTFTAITSNLAPFVSLGLGVDDMFVLAHTMRHHFQPDDSAEVNMVRCLCLAGPSVFLTSLANTVTFFITSTMPTKVIYYFGLSAGINVLFNFILLLLLFIPAMALDTKRMLARRIDIVPVKAKEEPPKKSGQESQSPLQAHCGVGRKSVTDQIADNLGKALSNVVIKVLVIVVFVAFFSVMLWSGITRTEHGLRTSDVALKDTYQHDMAALQESQFAIETPHIFTLTKDMSPNKTQQAYLDCLDSIEKNSKWIVRSMLPKATGWYADVRGTLLASYAADNPPATADTPIPTDKFQAYRQNWLSTSGIAHYANLVCRHENDTNIWDDCQKASSRLYSSKVTLYVKNQFSIDDFRASMRETRSLIDPYSKDGLRIFITGNMFFFYEQYLHIEDNALKTAGFTLLGVLLITFVFQFSPVLSLLVCVSVASTIVELWGLFNFINVKLNPFSVANLAISIGMSVEFTAHVARSFAVAQGTHDQRMRTALREMLAPMYHGAVSTILAVAVLAGSAFPFFRDYYCISFILMILIAVANGLVFLPVLLSLIGPAELADPGDDKKALTATRMSIRSSASSGKEAIPMDKTEPGEWQVQQ